MRKLCFPLFCLTFYAIFVFQPLAASKIFLSPDGSDNNDGTDIYSPLKSMVYALSKLNPESGDSIMLLPGTYLVKQSIYLPPGINLIGYDPDNSKTILQYDFSEPADIFINMKNDFQEGSVVRDAFVKGNQTISNFTVDGNKQAVEGIVCTGRHGITIKNMIIQDCRRGGLNLSAYYDYFINGYKAKKIKGCEVLNCEFYENGMLNPQGDADYLSNVSIGGWEGGSIHDCIIIDTIPETNGGGLGMMGMKRSKVHDNKIMINVYETNHWGGIFSAVTGYTEGLEFFNNEVNSGISCENRVEEEKMNLQNTPNIMVFDNRFIGTHPNSVQIQAIELYVDYAEIYNNYFENFLHCITSWLGNDTVTNVDIHHNVFRGADKGYAIHLTMGGNSYEDPSNLTVYKNFNIYNNVFDNYNYAIYNPHGKTENFEIKNNVFLHLNNTVWQHTSEETCQNIHFDHNLTYDCTALQNDNSALFHNMTENTDPQFKLVGLKPSEWYQPESANAEVVDKGLELGEYTMGFGGNAPDLGAFEYDGSRPERLKSPMFDLPGGKYFGSQTLSLINYVPGSIIKYTLDGSYPDENHGEIYNTPVEITEPTTIKAIAVAENMISSVINEGYFDICQQKAASVSIVPIAGTFNVPQVIHLNTSTPNASIYYSINGRNPNAATGHLYEAPFYLDSSLTLSAIAYAEGYYESDFQFHHYDISFTDPGNGIIYNDSSESFRWSEHYWAYRADRNLGDYNNDIHITFNEGSYFEFDFSGQGLAILTERNNDKTKSAGVYIDDEYITSLNLYNPKRLTADTVFIFGHLSPGNHTLKLINNGSSGNMAIDAIVVYPEPMGQLIYLKNDNIKLFPVPAENNINISGLKMQGDYKIEIYGLTGKKHLCYEYQTKNDRCEIDTGNLPSGLYIMVISGNNESKSIKFIKN